MTPTSTYRIWIAGDYADAVAAARSWCSLIGDCYSMTRCDYVYSGGMEAGVCITRINYPRFPEVEQELEKRVFEFAEHVAAALFQKSYTVETPEEMHYITREGPWNA